MKRRLFLHLIYTSIASYTSHALFMVRGLLLAWLFGPALFGIWASMRLVVTFSHYASLGSRQGMLQLAPLAEGRGDPKEAALLRRASAGMCLIGALLAAAVVCVIALLQQDAAQRIHWWVFAAALLCVHLFVFYHATLRSHQMFSLAGVGDVIFAVISTTLGLLAAAWYGLVGFLGVFGLGYLAALLIVWRFGSVLPKPMFRRDEARRLIGAGWPLMASSGLCILLWNVDKLLLWTIQGSTALGEYAIQASFTNLALLAPTAIGTVLHPHIMRHLGEHRTAQSIRPYLRRGGELVAVWSGPIVAIGYLTLHLPIRWWLAQYTTAIEPGRILMLAAYFSMIATVPSTVLISLNGQRLLCTIRLIAIALTAAAGFYALQNGFGYVGLALAMTMGLVVDSLLSLEATLRLAEFDRPSSIGMIGSLIAPFVLLFVTLLLVCWLIPDRPDHWQGDLVATVARCAVVLVVCVPWAVWRSHRLELLK